MYIHAHAYTRTHARIPTSAKSVFQIKTNRKKAHLKKNTLPNRDESIGSYRAGSRIRWVPFRSIECPASDTVAAPCIQGLFLSWNWFGKKKKRGAWESGNGKKAMCCNGKWVWVCGCVCVAVNERGKMCCVLLSITISHTLLAPFKRSQWLNS